MSAPAAAERWWEPGDPVYLPWFAANPGRMFEVLEDDPDALRCDPMRWSPSCEPRPSWGWLS
jgi:hypothetical protein